MTDKDVEKLRGKAESEGSVSRKTGSARQLRIAIATQPALLRDVLSRSLSQETNLQVVGQGQNEDEIAEILKETVPQLLVFDYEALGPNSEGIVSRLHRLAPGTRILVMASRSGEDTVERVLRAGAAGLIGKQLGFDTLLKAIRAVAAGEVWANRRTTARALEHLTTFPTRAAGTEGQLTKRERQIVEAVTRGLRNKEIARHLNISEKTVKAHLNNVFQKLRLDGRFALALFEQAQGQPKT